MTHEITPNTLYRKMKLSFQLTLFISISLLVSACSFHQPKLNHLPKIEPNQLEGTWHIIAHIPYFFEKGHVGSKITYKARDDHAFDDIYTYRKTDFSAKEKTYSGTARIKNKLTNREWETQFFWPLSFSWHIFHLDPEEQTLVVGHPSRKYAWIMSRKPELPESKYQTLLAILESHQFEGFKLVKVPQFREQIGQPGFQ